MTKTVSYICRKCATLAHNCTCSCNNVATIVSDDGKSIQLFVDDIATVEQVCSYINKQGEVVRLDYLDVNTDTTIETGLPINLINNYTKIAKAYAKTSAMTNQQTDTLFTV